MKTDIQTQMKADKPEAVLSDLEAKHGLAPAQCSARTCDWETVSPPSVCGKTAAYASNTGLHYCQYHGEHMARKFPQLVHKMKAPNESR